VSTVQVVRTVGPGTTAAAAPEPVAAPPEPPPVVADNPGSAGGSTDPVGGECPASAPIKGNASSMIYHVPGGEFYDRTNPKKCFATEGPARAAGYRASKR